MAINKQAVAKRYGKAMFELAEETQQTATVYGELKMVRQIFEETPQLGEILSDVRLNANEKKTILEQLKQPWIEIVQNLLQLVFENGRMEVMTFIIDDFEKRYHKQQGIVCGTVTTAVALTAEQKEKLEKEVARKFGCREAQLRDVVDATILGGVIVDANDTLIDGSVKNRLARLRKTLLK